jgi:hypothetical protein
MSEKSMAKVNAPRAGRLASPPKSLGLTIPQTLLLRVGLASGRIAVLDGAKEISDEDASGCTSCGGVRSVPA